VVKKIGKMFGKPATGRKRLNVLGDLAENENICGTQKESRRQERWAEIEESWKLYSCYLADYLKKEEKKKAGVNEISLFGLQVLTVD